ncbi:MAG: ATP-binding protein [Acholeplasmataceae bacterium]|jgi:primosomal protein DnaI|nr:ATP-binding protein [Acholeplasmataceae bacterium]
MSFKELLKEIKAFEETKDLELNYHEIMTVYQYVKKKKAFNPNDPNELYEPVLKLNPARIEYVPSKAYQKALDERSKMKFIDTTYHNDYLLDAKLADFKLLNDERKKALEIAQTFIADYEKKKFLKGLYLYGQNRTGKTFLLSAIANELSQKNIQIVFAYVPDLIRSIYSSMDDNTLEIKIKQLKNCDLLVLDDLGSAFMSLWFRDQIFGPIIQYRLSVGLPILVSSNLDAQQLTSFMIDPDAPNDKYNAVRITARIVEMTMPVSLNQLRYKNN